MALFPEPSSPTEASRSGAKRLFGRWWRSQSRARQDRFATLGPLLSVLLFLAAITSSLSIYQPAVALIKACLGWSHARATATIATQPRRSEAKKLGPDSRPTV